VGSPGTGKTYFAKLMASMNDSEFFGASASQFDEIFVGRGPQRVRNLFSDARDFIKPTFYERIRMALNLNVTRRKALIFIDEIDALGSRYNSLVHSTTQATVSQLLAELDGINERRDIIFVAATNHYKQLDEALKRSGRFSRIIEFKLPNNESRKDLIRFYLKDIDCVPLKNEELNLLANDTEGFSSADMKQLISDAKMILIRSEVNNRKNQLVNSKTDLSINHIKEAIIALKKKKTFEPSYSPNKLI